jgi:hypothetical protein
VLDFAYVKRVEGQPAPWRADESADCLLRFVGRVPLVAFGVGCRAGIHTMAFASVVPSASGDRADGGNQQEQKDPPSLQHLRAPRVKQRITAAPKRSLRV